MAKFFSDFLNNSKSNIPRLNPAPKIGPINGEISMAPIITAVELTFNPTDAMMMAQAKIHKLDPRNEIFESTFSSTLFLSSSPWWRFTKRVIFCIILFFLKNLNLNGCFYKFNIIWFRLPAYFKRWFEFSLIFQVVRILLMDNSPLAVFHFMFLNTWIPCWF